MSPEDVVGAIENNLYEYAPTRIQLAQLSMTAQLLIEIRALRREIVHAIPQEPLQVEVCNTVYTSSAP